MSLFKSKKPKVFCIGLNKTGTTSLGAFLEQQGLPVERQVNGERMLKNYLSRDFKTIIKACKASPNTVFQDIPYSLPYTFIHLDNAFPSAKFILTVRDSPEQWYQSILSFHSQRFNKGNKPDAESLQNSKYIYKGWAWDLMNDVFIKNNPNTYDMKEFINVYNTHNEMVIDYFKDHNKLMVINLSIDADAVRLCEFLGLPSKVEGFPKISSNDISSRNYEVKFLGLNE